MTGRGGGDAMDSFVRLQPAVTISGLLPLVVVVLCIVLAWWCLQEFRFDLFLKRPKSAQGKLLQVLLAVVFGYAIAKFFLDYLQWSVAWSSFIHGFSRPE